MEIKKRKPNWHSYSIREVVTDFEAGCLLAGMAPINPKLKIWNDHPRYAEILLYVSEAHSNIASLDHAGLIHKKIIQNYRSIPASDSFLSGYVKKTTRATKSRLIETVVMSELVKFAKENDFHECFKGLTGQLSPPEKSIDDKMLKTLMPVIKIIEDFADSPEFKKYSDKVQQGQIQGWLIESKGKTSREIETLKQLISSYYDIKTGQKK